MLKPQGLCTHSLQCLTFLPALLKLALSYLSGLSGLHLPPGAFPEHPLKHPVHMHPLYLPVYSLCSRRHGHKGLSFSFAWWVIPNQVACGRKGSFVGLKG